MRIGPVVHTKTYIYIPIYIYFYYNSIAIIIIVKLQKRHYNTSVVSGCVVALTRRYLNPHFWHQCSPPLGVPPCMRRRTWYLITDVTCICRRINNNTDNTGLQGVVDTRRKAPPIRLTVQLHSLCSTNLSGERPIADHAIIPHLSPQSAVYFFLVLHNCCTTIINNN